MPGRPTLRGANAEGSVVAIMARSPARPSAVKTRLAGAIPNTRARVDLYTAFIADQMRVCRSLSNITLRMAYTPEGSAKDFEPMGLSPEELVLQRGHDLATRERALFEDLFEEGFRRVVIIGSDLPSLPGRILEDAFRRLDRPRRVVLGPAEDGGYYLVGLSRDGATASVPDLFSNIRWSTTWTLSDTIAAAEQTRTIVELVEPWYDVDDQAGLQRLRDQLSSPAWAAAVPATAAVLKKIF